MDFTMKSTENTEIQTLGNTAQKFSTIYRSVQLWTEKLFVFTVASVRKSKLSIKSEPLTEKSKFLTKGHSVTWCGQILRIFKIGQ